MNFMNFITCRGRNIKPQLNSVAGEILGSVNETRKPHYSLMLLKGILTASVLPNKR